MVEDHLSRLDNKEVTKNENPIIAEFPDERLFVVEERPWFAEMKIFKADNMVSNEFT